MRPRLPALGAVLMCVALLASCGPDDTGTIAGPTTSATEAPPASSPSTDVPLTTPFTTPFTFAPKDTMPFAPGQGSLTVSGDQQATGQFSAASCGGITVTESRGVVAILTFVSDAGLVTAKRWVLELVGMSPGSSTFPEPAGFNQIPPRRIRLTLDAAAAGLLTWGTNAAGEGIVTGTLTARVGNAKAGMFDLRLGFAGTEGNTVPLSSYGPVEIKGDWNCPTS